MKKYKFKGRLEPRILERDWEEDGGVYRIIKTVYPNKALFLLLVRGWMANMLSMPLYCPFTQQKIKSVSLIETDCTSSFHKQAIKSLKTDLSYFYQLRAAGRKHIEQPVVSTIREILGSFGATMQLLHDDSAIETYVYGDFEPQHFLYRAEGRELSQEEAGELNHIRVQIKSPTVSEFNELFKKHLQSRGPVRIETPKNTCAALVGFDRAVSAYHRARKDHRPVVDYFTLERDRLSKTLS